MLLAIDTSTRYAGVALMDAQGRLVQLSAWHSRHNHSVEVLPAIEAVLKREGCAAKDLNGIAIATGPGSFSALRVGLSVAKGLAWPSSVPLVSATTLEAEAFPYRLGGIPICAALDAGRGEIAWALFHSEEGVLCQDGPERIGAPNGLLDALPSPSLLCGEALEKYADALSAAGRPGITLALPYLPGQRVIALAHLGLARLKAGRVQDPVTLQPLYLRRPTITEPQPRT